MAGTSNFFSSGHEKLLNIATWARLIAKIIFGFFFLYAGFLLAQGITSYASSIKEHMNFWGMLTEKPIYTLCLLLATVTTFFKGVVFYLVLEGVSLGLNMIVETNIDYREIEEKKENEEGEGGQ